jgi:hypothetical protein
VDPQNPEFWRISFAVIALGGMAATLAVHGLRAGPARLSDTAHIAAFVLYLLIGVLAVVPSPLLRAEAVLLILLVFTGFNVAWLLLYHRVAAVPATVPAPAVPGADQP